MAGHKDSFANKIRTSAKKLREDPFGYADIYSTAELVSNTEEEQMRNTMRDFIKRGEILRIKPGLFRYVGRKKDRQQVEKRKVMWNILKMRRTVSVADLQEMAGVTLEYAREWLRGLERRDIVCKIKNGAASNPCKWRLLKDLTEMPEDEERKAKYRQIRRQKKKTLAGVLDSIQAGIDKARTLVEEI